MAYYKVTVTLNSEGIYEAEDEYTAIHDMCCNLRDPKGQYEVTDAKAVEVEKPEDWED